MPQYLCLPYQQLQESTLQALLEEFASREGTEYGEREFTLEQKVLALRARLQCGDMKLLYDGQGEQWDLVPCEQAEQLLRAEVADGG